MTPKSADAPVKGAFPCLRVHNFCLVFVGNAVSQTGTWAQMVAQGWLVFTLTGSGLWVGVVAAAQRLPSLVIGPWTGVFVDRIDQRRIMLATQALYGVVSLTLGLLTISGTVRLWMIMLLATLYGAVTIVDWPARMSFVPRIVGDDEVASATALYVGASQAARIVGPAAAGVLIATLGTGFAFLLDAGSAVVVLVLLALVRQHQLRPRAPGGGHETGAIRAGLALVGRVPALRRAVLATAVMCGFGMNWQVTFPLLAERAFDRGADGFAVLTAAMGAGSVIGAVFTARSGRPSWRRMSRSGAAFGVLTVIAALAPTLPIAAGTMFVGGMFSVAFMATAHATVQTTSPTAFCGRVLAVYVSVIMGANMLGAPLLGALSEAFGARTGAAFGGLLTATGILIVLPRPWAAERLTSPDRSVTLADDDLPDPALT